MNALDEVLKVEQEVDLEIEAAKNAASAAITASRVEQKSVIDSETGKLAEFEKDTLDTKQKEVEVEVKAIIAKLQSKAEEIEKQFLSKKDSVKTDVKNSIS